MLEENEVELVKWAKEADHWSEKESKLQACLQRAGSMVNLSRVDWERKLAEILTEGAPIDCNV